MLTAVLSILPAVILSRRAMRRRTSGSSPLSDRHVRMDVGRRKPVIHALFGAIGSVSAGLPPPTGRAHSRLVHAPGWPIPSRVSGPSGAPFAAGAVPHAGVGGGDYALYREKAGRGRRHHLRRSAASGAGHGHGARVR